MARQYRDKHTWGQAYGAGGVQLCDAAGAMIQEVDEELVMGLEDGFQRLIAHGLVSPDLVQNIPCVRRWQWGCGRLVRMRRSSCI